MTQLEEMADLLLESYAGAITAKVEREEEYRGLQMEYWSRRDTLLTALQQYAAQVAQTAAQVFTLMYFCCLLSVHILVVHGWTVDQETAHMHNGQGGK